MRERVHWIKLQLEHSMRIENKGQVVLQDNDLDMSSEIVLSCSLRGGRVPQRKAVSQRNCSQVGDKLQHERVEKTAEDIFLGHGCLCTYV